MFRPLGASDLEIRLVLFGPGTGNRWTSTQSHILPGDGVWNTYIYSILEIDLTRVLGGSSYADLVGNLNRIMFRHDEGGPSAQGTSVGFNADPFYIDNVTAVPIPASIWLFASGIAALAFRLRRRVD
jgi:hypothetical protein